MKTKIVIYILVIIFLSGCVIEKNNTSDLDEIKKRGKLIAITSYNSYSYFMYRGEEMGYEYELIKRYADYLGVKLELKVEKNIEAMIEMLNNGEGDLIAYNLTVTKDRSERVAFSEYLNLTNQVLVQAKPKNWRQLKPYELENIIVRNPIELENEKIYVRAGTGYKERLENFANETGTNFTIIEAGLDLSTEDLIKMVSEGKIKFTISDANIARINHLAFPNIDYDTPISLTQKIAWATRKDSDSLLKNLNTWIESIKNTSDYYVIYNKYFKRRHIFRGNDRIEGLELKNGKLTNHDNIIKKYAKKLDCDWLLLASLIYQESRFDPNAQSWAGAVGLMQIMPSLVEKYKVKNPFDPIENMEAGFQYLVYLDNFWKNYVEDKNERLKMVFASYNIGYGHVLDAYNLAKKYNANPQVWFNNVEDFLTKKSEAKYYTDPVVKNGYCSGTQTLAFVTKIFERYNYQIQKQG